MVIVSGHRTRRAPAIAALVLLCCAGPARAQSSISFGGGASVDPRQTYAGVAWESSDIAGRFRFRPGIDGGFGGDFRLGTVNLDFVAHVPIGQSAWTLVQGGGPVIVIATFTSDTTAADMREVHVGGSYLLGFQHHNGFFSEFRLGGGGYTPNLKVGAGWVVKMK